MRNWFSFLIGSPEATSDCAIPSMFNLALKDSVFIKADIVATYSKILTDTVERMHGIPDAILPHLFDSCVKSDASEGLITLIATAMAEESELYLVFKEDVLRRATSEEERAIREDYKAKTESALGVYISFQDYRRTQMLKIYSAFEYCVLSSLNKTLNISKAVQVKLADLRAGVGLQDAPVALAQAKAMAQALASGNDITMDVKDMIEMATVDTSTTEKAIGFLDAKRAYYLGLPMSYISGIQTTGIGSTGEADMRAVERGLKQYFVSILQPAVKAVFAADTEFKSQDFRQIQSALEAAKTFDIISDDYVSKQGKTEILRRMFELDPEEEEAAMAEELLQSQDSKVTSGDPIRPQGNTAADGAQENN